MAMYSSRPAAWCAALVIFFLTSAPTQAQDCLDASSPARGQVGTRVTIAGERLHGEKYGAAVESVLLAGVPATIVTDTDSEVVVIAGDGAGDMQGDVVLVADSGAQAVMSNIWQYYPSGRVESATPSSGTQGTRLTLHGQGLLGGGTSLASATLNAVPAVVMQANASSVVLQVPAFNHTSTLNVSLVANTGAVISQTNVFEYKADATVADVTPTRGQIYTQVVIQGTNLLLYGSEVTSVSLAGHEALILSFTNERIVVTLPNHNNTVDLEGPIRISNGAGAYLEAEQRFTLQTKGVISSLTPSSGRWGTIVTIAGSNLLAADVALSSVSFGGRLATVLNASDEVVTVTVPQGPQDATFATVELKATTGGAVSLTDGFRYLTPGEVDSVTPNSGREGTLVTIRGLNLCGGGSAISDVTLAGFAAVVNPSTTCSQIVVTVQDYGALKTGPVVVRANTGALLQSDRSDTNFTYIADGSVTSVTPSAGTQGDLVTIRGERMLGGGSSVTSLTLAGQPVVSVVFANDSLITAFVGSGAAAPLGVADVVIRSNTGTTVRGVEAWTYARITNVSPAQGQEGTRVTITGVALAAGGSTITAVRFGAAAASIVEQSNASQVIVRAPNAIAGDVAIVLTSDSGQTLTLNPGFEYLARGAIDNVVPAQGMYKTRITVTGSRLLGNGVTLAGMTVVGVPVLSILEASNTRVVAIVNASASAQGGDIVLTSDTGAVVDMTTGQAQNTLPDGEWKYVQPGVIDSVTPGFGQLGTLVTLQGTGLRGGSTGAVVSVALHGVAGTLESESDTSVVVVAGNGDAALGQGDVVLTGADGAEITLAGGFTYREQGQVATVTPRSGQEGTRVTIRGTNLLAHGTSLSSVTLGGVSGTIESQSNETVVVVAGPGVVTGNGTVELVAASGGIVTLTTGFEYLPASNVTAVAPATVHAGVLVTISGQRLLGGGASIASVHLAGVAVATIESGGDSEIVVHAGASATALAAGDVEIVADTGAVALLADVVAYAAPAEVERLEPATGRRGTRVTVFGQNLLMAGTSVANAWLGSDAVSVRFNNDSVVVLEVGPAVGGPVGTPVAVRLEADNGGATTSAAPLWTPYPPGSITAAFPSSGSGGTVVNISTNNLLAGGASLVHASIAGEEAEIIDGVHEGFAVVLVPFVSAVSGPIRLEADNGAYVSSVFNFTVLTPIQLSAVEPILGYVGTRVLISGKFYFLQTDVQELYLANAAAEVLSVNATHLNARIISAGYAPGAGPIRVVLKSGAYASSAPQLNWTGTSVPVFSGSNVTQATWGTFMSLVGSDLHLGSQLAEVFLGGQPVLNLAGSNESLDFRAPKNMVAGMVDVELRALSGAYHVFSNVTMSVAPGAIEDIAPAVGQKGTIVTLTGKRLLGFSETFGAAWLANRPANVIFANASTVMLRTPDEPVSSDVALLQASDGSFAESTVTFELRTAGAISQISPLVAGPGATVYIVGTNLLGYASALHRVLLAGQKADILYESDNLVRVAVPSGYGSGQVLIEAMSGATIFSTSNFSFVGNATLSSVEPAVGQQGMLITLRGEGFLQGAAVLSSVQFGDYQTRIVFYNDSAVLVRLFDGPTSPSTVDVALVAQSGATTVFEAAFSFIAPVDIDAVTPASGQQGTLVTIRGAQLLAGTGDSATIASVTLAGVPAEVLHASDLSLVVRAGALSVAITGDVVLSLAIGAEARQSGAFSYVPLPNVTSVHPATVQRGTLVTLVGTRLLLGAQEIISATLANQSAEVVSSSSSHVVLRAPNGTGAGFVSYTVDSGAFYSPMQPITFAAETRILSVSPASGMYGTRVTLAGVGLFQGGSVQAVLVAGVGAIVLTANASHLVVELVNTMPASAPIQLLGSTGAETWSETNLTVLTTPLVTTVSPARAQQGTRVTLQGSNLLGGGNTIREVLLNGGSTWTVESLAATNDAVIFAFPAGVTAATIAVTLVADTGARMDSIASLTALGDGAVSTFLPVRGVEGTVVTVVGTGLRAAAPEGATLSASVAGTAAHVLFSNDTMVVLVLGDAGIATTGPIVLKANTSGTIVSLTNFTYMPPSRIDTVTPASGQEGTYVTITGSSLQGGANLSQVVIGNVTASIMSESAHLVVVRLGYAADMIGDATISLSSLTGSAIQASGVFSYLSRPTIAVAPTSGNQGTRVTLMGQSLLLGADDIERVLLGGLEVSNITETSDTRVVVLAPYRALAMNNASLRVELTSGAFYELAGAWSFVDHPTVSNVAPRRCNRGCRVTLTGTHLLAGAADLSYVNVGGHVAVPESASQTTIVFRVPVQDVQENVTLRLSAPTGAWYDVAEAFSWGSTPSIAPLVPSSGQVGTRIAVQGISMLGIAGTRFARISLGQTNVTPTFANATSIVFSALSHPAGSAMLELEADSGELVSLTDAFNFTPASQIHRVVPASGQAGTLVTVSGSRLLGAGHRVAAVVLDGMPAQLVSSDVNATFLIVEVQARTDGNVSRPAGNVEVISDTGATAVFVAGFKYRTPSAITQVQPLQGTEGTIVSLFGTGLLANASGSPTVELAGLTAGVLTFNDTVVRVQLPRHEGPELVGSVVLRAADGSRAVFNDNFTLAILPNVTSVQPGLGQHGTKVTLTGTNLRAYGADVEAVTFGGIMGELLLANDSFVVARAPKRAVSVDTEVEVVLQSTSGAVVRTSWIYRRAGVVVGTDSQVVSPGAIVTVSGLDLCGHGTRVSQVRLAGQEFEPLAGASCNQVRFTMPVGMNHTEAINATFELEADTGALVNSDEVYLTILPEGRIDRVEPEAGVRGQIVTLYGAFLPSDGVALDVSIAGAATRVLSSNSTFVRVEILDQGTGTGNVVVSASSGAVVEATSAFSFAVMSTITPASGRHGTRVTVNGEHLLRDGNLSAVYLCGAEAILESATDETVIFTAPAPPTAINPPALCTLQLRAGYTLVDLTRSDAFTVLQPATLTSMAHSDRFHNGVNTTLVGERLLGGGSAVAELWLQGNVRVAVLDTGSDSALSFQVPAGLVAGSGDVTIVADTGAISTFTGAFTAAPQANINSLSRINGTNGTVVSLFGTDLLMGDTVVRVEVAGVEAEILAQSAANVTFRVAGALAIQGDVFVQASTGAFVELLNGWSYGTPAVITAIVPNRGFTNNTVTVHGENLLAHGEAVVRATLAGVPAAILTYNNTQVVLRAGQPMDPFAEISGRVILHSNSGAHVTLGGAAFTYRQAGQIIAATPARVRAGTRLTITGQELLGGGALLSLDIGGVAWTDINLANDSVIVARAPITMAGVEPGPVAITIEATSGSRVHVLNATTVVPPGAIISMHPARLATGTIVTLQGTQLLGGGSTVSHLLLAGVNASAVLQANDTVITAVAGPRTQEAASVSLFMESDTGAQLHANLTDGAYVVPTISSISPRVVQVNTILSISGRALLAGGTEVVDLQLGALSIEPTFANDTFMLLSLPEAAVDAVNSATLRVTVNTGGSWERSDAVDIQLPGEISSVQPTRGATSTVVTLTGSRLLGSSALPLREVLFGDVAAQVLSASSTTVVVRLVGLITTPSNVTVTLISESGATVHSASNSFELLLAPDITVVQPSVASYGTRVTLQGTNLLAGSASNPSTASLAGVPADIQSYTDEAIVLVVRGGVGSNVSLNMTLPNGALLARPALPLTLLPRPLVQTVTPSSGRIGTRVTLLGHGLTGGSGAVARAALAGVDAAIEFANDTMLILIANNEEDAASTSVLVEGATGSLSEGGSFTWVASEVETVLPAQGTRGTLVRIYGRRLLGGATSVRVFFENTEATIVPPAFDLFIEVATPLTMVEGAANITILGDTGARVRVVNAFNFLPPADITNVAPTSGQAGTRVTISGTALLGGGTSLSSVTVAGVGADVLSANDTQVVVSANSGQHGTTGSVTLRANTGAFVESVQTYTYTIAGQIDSIVPSSGMYGTLVTLRGRFLFAHSSGLVHASLNDVEAEIVNASRTVVVLRAAVGVPGVGDVVLTTESGAAVMIPLAFSYVPVPIVASVTPRYGVQGTRVTLTGSHLLGGASSLALVRAAGVLAEQILSASNTKIVLALAAAAPSSGVIEIAASSGAKYNSSQIVEYLTAPVIDAVNPSEGQQGTTVTITGTHLLGYGLNLTQVSLAGVSVESVALQNDTHVIVQAGHAVEAAQGDVVLTADSGARTALSNGFTYHPRGAILQVSPSTTYLGSRVVLTGTNLTAHGTSVAHAYVGSAEAEVLPGSNASTVVIRLPLSGVSAGPQTLVLLNEHGGRVELAAGLVLAPTPTVERIFPAVAQEGTYVTISGRDLGLGVGALNTLSVNNVSASNILGQNATQVVFRLGPSPAGAASLVLSTAEGGTYAYSATSAELDILEPAQVTAISPDRGQEGSYVTIAGHNLLLNTSVIDVTLANVSAVIVRASSTELVVRAGLGAAGRGDVVLRGASGAFVRADGFEYASVAIITAVSPSYGRRGTWVTITGSGLLAGGASIADVQLGNVSATAIRPASNDTHVVVRAADQEPAANLSVVVVADSGAISKAVGVWTQDTRGTITTITPSSCQSHTRVTLTGDNLLGSVALDAHLLQLEVAGSPALIAAANNTVVVFACPELSANVTVAADIALLSSTGALLAVPALLTVLPTGIIDLVHPNSGTYGTTVRIYGQRLLTGAAVEAVLLAGVASEVLTASDDEIVVRVLGTPSALSGSVRVQGTQGGEIESGVAAFTYVVPPIVTAVDPPVVQATTVVTLTGTGLLAGSTGMPQVEVGGAPALSVEAYSDASIVFVAPDHAAGSTLPVHVTASSNATYALVNLTYAERMRIDAVIPDVGMEGALVTIRGQHLLQGSEAIASAALASVAVDIVQAADSAVVVRLPAAGPAVGSVRLELASGASQTGANFTIGPAPTIESVTPASGSAGTRVTLAGQHLDLYSNLSTVRLAGVPSTEIIMANDTLLVVRAGAAASARNATVRLEATSGAHFEGARFAFVTPPVISLLQPAAGTTGTEVNVIGSGLRAGGNAIVSATIAGVPATIIDGSNDFSVTLKAQAATARNGVIVLVADTGATVASGQSWTYLPPAVISSVFPAAGAASTVITIYGQHLLQGSSNPLTLTVAGATADVTFQNDTVVVATTARCGSSCSRAGPLVLAARSGATVSSNFSWVYGEITAVNPTSGQLGTLVTLDGRSLYLDGTQVTNVRLAGVNVESIVSQSDMRVVVRAAAGVATGAAADVVIEVDSGSMTALSQAWTYAPSSIITDVVPLTGQLDTRVTVTGQRLFGQGSSLVAALFNNVSMPIEAQSSTQVVVRIQTATAGSSLPITLISNTGARSEYTGWTQLEDGAIEHIDREFGQFGTVVTIRGRGLLGGSAVRSVTLVGLEVQEILSANNSMVIVVADNRTSSQGDVVITADTGATVTAVDGFFFNRTGNVSSVTPAVIHEGTRVSIRGERLRLSAEAVTRVWIGGVLAAIESENNTLVVVRAGARPTAGSALNVKIEANSGATITAHGIVDYGAPGEIEAVIPGSGVQGTQVVIEGRHLQAHAGAITAVLLAGIEATLVAANDTSIHVIANSHSVDGYGDIKIETSTGAFVLGTVGTGMGFQYLEEALYLDAFPPQGRTGTFVTFCGDETILGGGSRFAEVYVGTRSVSIEAYNATCVRVQL